MYPYDWSCALTLWKLKYMTRAVGRYDSRAVWFWLDRVVDGEKAQEAHDRAEGVEAPKPSFERPFAWGWDRLLAEICEADDWLSID